MLAMAPLMHALGYLMRRKLIRWLAWLLVFLFISSMALFWFTPASMLDYWLEKQQSPLQLGLVKGSWRDGQAGLAQFNGIDIGELKWQFGNYKLKPATAELQFQAKSPQMQVQGDLSVDIDDRISSTGMQGYFPARWLDLQHIAPWLFADGKINFDLKHLKLDKQAIPEISGTLDWQQAGLSGLVTAKLGDLHFVIENPVQTDNQITVSFSNKGEADISLSGTVSSDGKFYQLNAYAKGSADRDDINNFLQRVGQLQRNGQYQITFNGKLFPDEN